MPTHAETRAHLANAFAELVAGGDLRVVAHKYGYKVKTLQSHCYAKGIKTTNSHPARRERMAQAVLDVSAGIEPRVVAERYGITLPYLRQLCEKLEVSTRTRSRTLDRTLSLIAALLNDPEATYDVIAQQFGVTRQRVQQIRAKAESAGIRFPGRRTRPQTAD